MAEKFYLKRRQCTLSLTSSGCFVSKGSLGNGSFGSQWTSMKKDFNGKFKHEGEREYNIMAILNTLDKAQNGDGGKHIVTVQNVPSKYKGGFAFTTPLALCSLAEFQQDRSRVSGLTNGIILKSLVQGVEFLHENHYAHGDIKPANVLLFSVFSKPEVRLTDFGNSPHKVRGSASGTCGYRYPWPDWIDIFCGDWWSLGLLTGGLFLSEGKRVLSDEAILGFGQKATKQQRFWKFLEVKLGQPASVYLPYLRTVLKRDANLLDRKMSAACLDSAADLMLDLESKRKRPRPALIETLPSKRPKHQAPPAPEAPQTPLSSRQRRNKMRHERAKRKKMELSGCNKW